MWLTQARLDSLTEDRELGAVFNELFPDGATVTSARCVRVERRAAERGYEPLDWTNLAFATLTDAGWRKYNADVDSFTRERAVADAVRVDRVEARYHHALARWRLEHQVAPRGSMTDVARRAKMQLESEYNVKRSRVARERGRFRARLFGELAAENGRDEFARPPTPVELAPGEVLVTARTLANLGSCPTYVSRFRARWPHGTVITTQRCVDNASQFEWGWAAGNLLDRAYVHEHENRCYQERERLYQRERKARRDADDRLTALRQDLNAGRVTNGQYEEKLNAIDRERGHELDEVNRELTTLHARVFGELYEQHPRADLARYA